MSQPPTPELDKMAAVRERADALTAFVDWLAKDGIVLARYGTLYDVRLPCPACCLSTEGVKQRGVPRGRVPGCAGLDIASLSTREKQVLRSLEGVNTYKATLLRDRPCPRCRGEMFILEERVRDDELHEIHESYERLFARFFEIDQDACEAERRALLEHLRNG